MTARPVMLDLFCGCGGCSVGYHRAGFDVVGVDLARQHEYPFEFHARDALAFLAETDLSRFAAIHASPPCKAHTALRHSTRTGVIPLFDPHPDLVDATRAALIATGLPYVIENVPGAPLRNPVTYCGSSFGLAVRRHRLFESNARLRAPACRHVEQGQPVGVYGVGGAQRADHHGSTKVVGAAAGAALGIDWTTDQSRLSQAIPPAYTEHLGRQLLGQLGGAR